MSNPINTTIPITINPGTVATASSNPFVFQFSSNSPTTSDIQYPIQKQWLNTSAEQFWLLQNFTTASGLLFANWIKYGSQNIIEALQGNTGGLVYPLITPTANYINVVGDGTFITVAGTPATHTLLIEPAGGLATTYTENSGTAQAAAGNLNVFGSGAITTSGSGSTITITTTGAVATTYTEDTGTATPSANNLNIKGGTGIATSGAGSTVTVATTGAVATTYTEDSGTATPSANNLNISGGAYISTSGSGSTVTVALNPTVGSWTPNLAFGGSSTGITYVLRSGAYIKIGTLVFCDFTIDLSSKGAQVGTASVTNLPFTSNGQTVAGTGALNTENITLTANYTWINANVGTSTAAMGFVQNGSGQLLFSMTNSNFSDNTKLQGSITYISAT